MPKYGRFSRCSLHHPLLTCEFSLLRRSDRTRAQSLPLSRCPVQRLKRLTTVHALERLPPHWV